MPSFRSATAYPQLYYMLKHREFKQRAMARDLDITHGSRISGFVNWLVKLGYVAKARNTKHRLNVYSVDAPVALISFYSHFRDMKADRLTLDWGTDRDRVIEYLKEKGGVFCLTTALAHYSNYVRDPAIHAYVDRDFMDEMQKKETFGTVRVHMYPFEPFMKDNWIEKDGMKITTKIRTLIDLYCDNKAYTTEDLVRQLW